ncbi:uncharacterized protein AMSG_03192 [Thecamonas trahens ATCC 50062]|uniref:U1-C C2H2-type zinc finger domain-containing protein n=1 Tax=Thecamonas trahens ATCC 50062 TaxID=461836 RepID=A0A0L0D377_THETB|nr:hypothetical protein AMSG_03192 [Thecamonas trahens ATCC 50062]KNC46764.1 hypothetical protein AMSG_03192 [Thecamonas trahens ATCC 50062]|eukprot:XP_013760042.1 hypothetical protein AMSG_03192 [Thecamonas trahens ATCC 50062]
MPNCDYCDKFLVRGTASERISHNTGWRHTDVVRQYYQELLDEVPRLKALSASIAVKAVFDTPPPNMRHGSPPEEFVAPKDWDSPPPPMVPLHVLGLGGPPAHGHPLHPHQPHPHMAPLMQQHPPPHHMMQHPPHPGMHMPMSIPGGHAMPIHPQQQIHPAHYPPHMAGPPPAAAYPVPSPYPGAHPAHQAHAMPPQHQQQFPPQDPAAAAAEQARVQARIHAAAAATGANPHDASRKRALEPEPENAPALGQDPSKRQKTLASS